MNDGNELNEPLLVLHNSNINESRSNRATKESERRIFLNDVTRNETFGYCSNRVITSKYTSYNFLPKFLGLSFMYPANVYFLLICILQVIPGISNTYGVPTQAFPLAFVITVDAVFQIIEDLKRHKADDEANGRIAERLCPISKKVSKIRWEDIQVGDILKMKDSDMASADVILFGIESGMEKKKYCYVETKNLDGETNLKMREALECTMKYEEGFSNLYGVVTCDSPNGLINKFQGVLHTSSGEIEPISLYNMVLRGSILRNADVIYGFVVNTGHDTKIMQAAKECPSKKSAVEWQIDREILILIGVLMLFCASAATLAAVYNMLILKGDWYLNMEKNSIVQWVATFFRFFLILSNLVPISLYVSINLIKFLQSYFMRNDLEMYCASKNTPCDVRTMALNEELGQISHIFTDKTGTLTCNQMAFQKCSIHGVSYGKQPRSQVRPFETLKNPWVDFYDEQFMEKVNQQDPHLYDYLMHLSLCHSVIPEDKCDGANGANGANGGNHQQGGMIHFSASSPDEQALISMAQMFGFQFVHRSPGVAKVIFPNQKEPITFEILDILEFSSTRKRMSTIIKDPISNTIQLLIKGADNVIFPRLLVAASTTPGKQTEGKSEQQTEGKSVQQTEGKSVQQLTQLHLQQYAQEGLRTLVIAKRILSEQVYGEWKEKYQTACRDIHEMQKRGRDEENAIDALMDEIEVDLELLGATGIADQLQEGAAQTIAYLRAAGIRFWMLTGDHPDTAQNVAFSCHLLDTTSQRIQLTANNQCNAINIPHFIRNANTNIHAYFVRKKSLGGKTQHEKNMVLNKTRKHRNTKLSFSSSTTTTTSMGSTTTTTSMGSSSTPTTSMGSTTTTSMGSTTTTSMGRSIPKKNLDHQIQETKEIILVVDGDSMSRAVEEDCIMDFLELLANCQVVIACRLSPGQKAQLVEMVKKHMNFSGRTLAIGDGANDVPMIQSADVGVGISGHEGLQAANNSDYSIAQFRFLRRLLLVHGRWNYRRISIAVSYIFYKNILLVMSQFWYSIVSGMSGQKFYNDWAVNLFNTLFTSLPVALLGVYDQDVEARVAERLPLLYLPGPLNKYFDRRVFWSWILSGILESGIICCVAVFALSSPGANGIPFGMWENGALAFTLVILVVDLKIALYQSKWTQLEVMFLTFSFLSWLITAFILSSGPSISFDWFYLFPTLLKAPVFWLCMILVPFALLWSDIVRLSYDAFLCPSYLQIVRKAVRDGTIAALESRSDAMIQIKHSINITQDNILKESNDTGSAIGFDRYTVLAESDICTKN